MVFGQGNKLKNKEVDFEQEIDLMRLFNIIKRKKIFILNVFFLGIFLSTISAFLAEKTWQGGFQIVINNYTNNDSKALGLGLNIPQIINSANNANNLKTQVAILKSPSVLMDIFNYVKSSKGLTKDQIQFRNWRNSFDFKLEEGTSVLNINYKDNDKDIILPVLNKISKKYQEYAGTKKQKQNQITVNYYENQVSLFKKKTNKSYREFVDYGNKHSLKINRYINNDEKQKNEEINIDNSINTEIQKKISEEKLLQVKSNLNIIQNKDDFDPQIFYLSTQFDIPEIEPMIVQLSSLNEKLEEASLKYKETDKTFLELDALINNKIKFLKYKIISILNIKISNLERSIALNTRDQNVLIEYKRLYGELNKNSQILSELEKALLMNNLESTRQENPWELITEPTLLPYNIYPNKSFVIARGGIIALLLGILISVAFEKYRGIIFSKEKLEEILDKKILGEIMINNNDSLEESIALLKGGFFMKKQISITFVLVGNIKDDIYTKLKNGLKKYFDKLNFVNSNQIKDIANSSNILFITAYGITKISEIKDLNNKISFYNEKIIGAIVISDIIQGTTWKNFYKEFSKNLVIFFKKYIKRIF